MPPPTLLARFRQLLGRAFRETGQAIDRVSLRAIKFTEKDGRMIRGYDPPFYFNKDFISRHRTLFPLLRRGSPEISDKENTFIAPCATIIGRVKIGSQSSVWYGSVLRADQANMGMGHSKETEDKWWENFNEDPTFEKGQRDETSAGGGILVGEKTNIQDGVIITASKNHTIIGDSVTIGHSAQIHSSKVGSNSLIGMGAMLEANSQVGESSFVGAGACVKPNTQIPSGELWVGNPARKLRDLTEEEREKLRYQADEVSACSNCFTIIIL